MAPGASVLWLVLLVAACSACDIVTATIHLKVTDDTRRVVYLGDFVFGPQGAVTLMLHRLDLPADLLRVAPSKAKNLSRVDDAVIRRDVRLGFAAVPVNSVQEARFAARFARGEVGRHADLSYAPADDHVDMDSESDEDNETVGDGYVLLPTGGTAQPREHRGKAVERFCFIDDALLTRVSGRRRNATMVTFALQGLRPSELVKWKWEQKVAFEGLYAMYFYNCADYTATASAVEPTDVRALPKRAVSYDVQLGVSWRGSSGAPVYLSYSDLPLLPMYVLFTLIFLGLAVVWVYLMHANPGEVKQIHYLMLLLVLVKALTLGLEFAKLQHYKNTGVDKSTLDYFYYTALTLKGIMLFGVILLLGSGWSILRGRLSENDTKILLVVLPLQVLINVCLVLVAEAGEGSKSWATWLGLLRMLDAVCCCCVLLPVFWSIKAMSVAAASNMDESTARDIARMRQFRSFYIIIVAYIYTTRILLVMLRNALPYEHAWIASCSSEIVAVAFYSYCGQGFAPGRRDPYVTVPTTEMMEVSQRAEISDTGRGK